MTPAGREINRLPRGTCSICGCQDLSPCISRGGETCSWADRKHTICTAHPKNPVVKKALETGKPQ